MISQVFITLFSLTSIWISFSLKAPIRRWGPVLGLAAQPFWFYTTYQAHQWGLFFLTSVYAVLYAERLVANWRQK